MWKESGPKKPKESARIVAKTPQKNGSPRFAVVRRGSPWFAAVRRSNLKHIENFSEPFGSPPVRRGSPPFARRTYGDPWLKPASMANR